MIKQTVEEINQEMIQSLLHINPILTHVFPLKKANPNYPDTLILTSGAPLEWDEYEHGQREAILGGALYEGLAQTKEEAEKKIIEGSIQVGACHDYQCIGSVTGVYTASMPVFVVQDYENGQAAYCNLFEGETKDKLTYGVYSTETKSNLDHLKEVIGPLLNDALEDLDGIPLKPLIRKAINMGDELHSRNSAASLLLTRELYPPLLSYYHEKQQQIEELLNYLNNDYNFLRLSMAYGKLLSDRIKDIKGCSLVTAMVFSSKEFAIRVSGLGNEWFRAPLPKGDVKLFEGYTEDDVAWLGGESCITETMGLGGFSQAAAFTLQAYSGGTPERMIENNLSMYEITVSEHDTFKIPYFKFRGTPFGIDIRKVIEKKKTPVINMGVAHKNGGQIGAGVVSAPIEAFEAAYEAYVKTYN